MLARIGKWIKFSDVEQKSSVNEPVDGNDISAAMKAIEILSEEKIERDSEQYSQALEVLRDIITKMRNSHMKSEEDIQKKYERMNLEYPTEPGGTGGVQNVT
jgi:hypothetical protein